MERIGQGLLAARLMMGISLITPTGDALAKGNPDHLQCYKVRDSNESVGEAVKLLNRQLGASECKVDLRSLQLCAPTAKFSDGSPEGDDPRGEALQTDFLCYKVRCKPDNNKLVVVSDQFGERKSRLGPTYTLYSNQEGTDSIALTSQHAGDEARYPLLCSLLKHINDVQVSAISLATARRNTLQKRRANNPSDGHEDRRQ